VNKRSLKKIQRTGLGTNLDLLATIVGAWQEGQGLAGRFLLLFHQRPKAACKLSEEVTL
jgi:hypothetical protein